MGEMDAARVEDALSPAEAEKRRADYVRAKYFLDMINQCRTLTVKQRRLLRRQALDGDLIGAQRRYERMLREAGLALRT